MITNSIRKNIKIFIKNVQKWLEKNKKYDSK